MKIFSLKTWEIYEKPTVIIFRKLTGLLGLFMIIRYDVQFFKAENYIGWL